MMSFKQTRQQLRQTLRRKRQSLTPQQQAQASQGLYQRLLAMTQPGDSLALYFANDGELSPDLAITKLAQQQRRVLVPVMHGFRKGYLNFQLYHANTVMRVNGFGIQEPVLDASQTLALAQIDYLFMPLVGFDSAGNRLGMGGGYYDRTLAKVTERNTKPRLIGLAHDCQQVSKLPVASWDVGIDEIITPTKKIMINP